LPYKNKESYKKWYAKNRKRKSELAKKYNHAHPEVHRRAWQKLWKKFQIERDKIFGTNCSLCNGRTKRMCLHEIHGKSHLRNPYFILKHKEDFQILCWKCHQMVHRFLDKKVNLEKFLELVQCPLGNPSHRESSPDKRYDKSYLFPPHSIRIMVKKQ